MKFVQYSQTGYVNIYKIVDVYVRGGSVVFSTTDMSGDQLVNVDIDFVYGFLDSLGIPRNFFHDNIR